MNKSIALCTLVLGLTLWSSQPIWAQDEATDSGTTQNLKKRIEKLVEEKRDQIEGVLSELGVTKRAFIGEVQRVSEESLTVKSKKGTEIISLTNVELRKAGKAIAIKDIAVGDWVVVLGIINNDAFQARRILVSSTSLQPTPKIVEIGTITATDRTTFTLKTRGTEEMLTVTTTKKTAYQDIQGNEIERTDITSETQALVIGQDKGGTKEATLIRVLTVVEDESTDR